MQSVLDLKPLDDFMVERKRIYWNRQALRLAYSAVIVWLGVSIALALLPKANGQARQGVSAVGDIFRGMLDAVLAAVALPGLFVVVLIIVAAVIHGRDVRR